MQSYLQSIRPRGSNNRFLNNEHFMNRHINPSVNNTQTNLNEQLEKYQERNIPTRKPFHKQDDYLPAKYAKAIQYKQERSYLIRSGQSFRQLQLFEDTKSLQYFGLGPYFYIEFMRRMVWLMFVLSLLQGIRIYLNAIGNGLSSYSFSFSTYLIITTLGNFSGNNFSGYDSYIVCILPAFELLLLFLFYLIWKWHYYKEIRDADIDQTNIKPQKFCLQVEPQQNIQLNEMQINRIFSNFGPLYQVSIVRQHRNKLQYFSQLQQLQEHIKQVELQLKLQQANEDELSKLRKQKNELLSKMEMFKFKTSDISAFIHFQYQKGKDDCIKYFHRKWLRNNLSHTCIRNICCCVDQPEQKYKIQGKKIILLKNQRVPTPEDINWQNYEIDCCSRFIRYLLVGIIIVLFLVLSCILIGLCSIYISTHSTDCSSIKIPSTLVLAQASVNPLVKTCYCNNNLVASFTDLAIESYCHEQLKQIYIEQSIQFLIIAVSGITNYLFGLAVEKLINCAKPKSQSAGLRTKTLIYTWFLILNTVVLPILLYSDIMGFKATNYFSLITLISSDVRNFLLVGNMQFYLDFTEIWYRNVSPIFTNYLIFDCFFVWGGFLLDKCRIGVDYLKNKQQKMIQKHMNEEITQFRINPYKEYSNFLLIIFMTFLLGSGIPVLIPLAFLNLFSRYLANRTLLQGYSSRIEGLGFKFSELQLTILPIILISSGLMGSWMLTANSKIYPSGVNLSLDITKFINFDLLNRQFSLPFFIILSFAVALEFLLFSLFLKFCACFCQSCRNAKSLSHTSREKPFSVHTKKMNILTSYNIKSNDRMRNAINRMEMYMQRSNK